MRSLEIGLVVFWLLLGVAVCVQSLQLGMMGPFGPDSGFFPFIAGTVLALSAIPVIVSRGRDIPRGRVFWGGRGEALRVLSVLALMVILIALMPHAGFLLSGCLVTPVMIRAVGGSSWVLALSIGFGAPVATYFLFVDVLNSPLPRGLLRGIL